MAQCRAMRTILTLGLLIALAACSGDPRSYGITGPGTHSAPATPANETPDSAPVAGVSTSGTSYGPSNRPTTGASGFWGYN